jgi:hypothetical protein
MSNIIIPQYKNPNKNNDKPFFRYNGFSISMSPNEKYPKMVEISKGPKSASKILGKKYVNELNPIIEYTSYTLDSNGLTIVLLFSISFIKKEVLVLLVLEMIEQELHF